MFSFFNQFDLCTNSIIIVSNQVRRICPYYFDLEEVFCARAGMIPKCRSDQMFRGRGRKDNDPTEASRYPTDQDMLAAATVLAEASRSEARTEEEEMMLEMDGDMAAEEFTSQEEESSEAHRRGSRGSRGSSTKKHRQPQNKEKTRRRGGKVLYPEDAQFNRLVKMMLDRNETQKKEDQNPENKMFEETMKISQLMTAFKEAKEAMGCPIKAAYQCPAFVRFLDKAEKRQYKLYKAEQDAESSEEEEGVDIGGGGGLGEGVGGDSRMDMGNNN